MFLRLPFGFDASVQHVALILNTVLLIALLIAIELRYAEAPQAKKQELRLFIPLLLMAAGVLVFAIYQQAGNA